MNGIKRDYELYVHINRINGKKYFGITGVGCKKRWQYGHGYKPNTYFNNAIKKYGWENFDHIIMLKNLSLEEANELEAWCIKKENTTNIKNGYNLSSGGKVNKHTEFTKKKISEKLKGIIKTKEHVENCVKHLRKKVIMLDCEGNLLREFESAYHAFRETGITQQNISRVCTGNRKTAGGYLWKHKN